MPTAILDEQGRVVLPKKFADELGFSKGDAVIFAKKGGTLVTRAASKRERLEEVMD
jgi:AbrB family looped-hinge helix DNA binding protein